MSDNHCKECRRIQETMENSNDVLKDVTKELHHTQVVVGQIEVKLQSLMDNSEQLQKILVGSNGRSVITRLEIIERENKHSRNNIYSQSKRRWELMVALIPTFLTGAIAVWLAVKDPVVISDQQIKKVLDSSKSLKSLKNTNQ